MAGTGDTYLKDVRLSYCGFGTAAYLELPVSGVHEILLIRRLTP